jgi:predicted amidohydrolase YtcJ
MFEKLETENGALDCRLRIEHAQHLSPLDIPRFCKLHVVASVRPYHAIDDGIGPLERIDFPRFQLEPVLLYLRKPGP